MGLTSKGGPASFVQAGSRPLRNLASSVVYGYEDFLESIYAKAVGVSVRQGRRDLGELGDLGLLERLGKGPATIYRVIGGAEHD